MYFCAVSLAPVFGGKFSVPYASGMKIYGAESKCIKVILYFVQTDNKKIRCANYVYYSPKSITHVSP